MEMNQIIFELVTRTKKQMNHVYCVRTLDQILSMDLQYENIYTFVDTGEQFSFCFGSEDLNKLKRYQVFMLKGNKSRIFVKFTFSVSGKYFTSEWLIQWCLFGFNDEVRTSLKSRHHILRSSVSNEFMNSLNQQFGQNLIFTKNICTLFTSE